MSQHTTYLGRALTNNQPDAAKPVSYALDHLTTHALLLGATGSGKTGMGLVIVEECLRSGIPVLLLDVKGDLANLLLTFPELTDQDFVPWVESSTAASETASLWRDGLSEWDLSATNIKSLRDTVNIQLFTPGLRAGNPIDILAQFDAPPHGDPDEIASHAQGLASALLSLAGVEADPLQSREHILITNLLRSAWENGQALDIPVLIQQVQNPPMQQVGVFDVESFFPQKARQSLALTLNNLLAAPGFAQWRAGNPLRIQDYLYSTEGKPCASVFYLAHLPEPQQRFFVTLFLEELRAWVRKQSGTRKLRALLFFDEVYGYLPPYPKNPPSKAPLMSLVKQGRAAGLGLLLSTQNAADLDYKGLGNIGTWFVGTLRTERDKHRVLEAMEGVVAQLGKRVADIDRALSNLESRVFLMYDTRAGKLEYLHSRWALSYLRGPLTTSEARRLATPLQEAERTPPTTTPSARQVIRQHNLYPTPVSRSSALTAMLSPPTIDTAIPQAFIPANITASWALREADTDPIDARLVYYPYLLGAAVAHLHDERTQTSLKDDQVWIVAATDESWNLRWENGEMISLRIDDLSTMPTMHASFVSLPRELKRKSAYPKWQSAFITHVRRHASVSLWGCTPIRLYSKPGESKRIFLEQCQQAIFKRRDQDMATAKRRYEYRAQMLEARIRKEELELEHDEIELTDRRREELLSGAETVMSLFSRRRRTRALSQTSRQRRYVRETEADVEESEQMLDTYYRQADELEESWRQAAQTVLDKWDNALSQIKEIQLYPKRTDIDVRFCGLAWFPYWQVEGSDRIAAYNT